MSLSSSLKSALAQNCFFWGSGAGGSGGGTFPGRLCPSSAVGRRGGSFLVGVSGVAPPTGNFFFLADRKLVGTRPCFPSFFRTFVQPPLSGSISSTSSSFKRSTMSLSSSLKSALAQNCFFWGSGAGGGGGGGCVFPDR